MSSIPSVVASSVASYKALQKQHKMHHTHDHHEHHEDHGDHSHTHIHAEHVPHENYWVDEHFIAVREKEEHIKEEIHEEELEKLFHALDHYAEELKKKGIKKEFYKKELEVLAKAIAEKKAEEEALFKKKKKDKEEDSNTDEVETLEENPDHLPSQKPNLLTISPTSIKMTGSKIKYYEFGD